MDSDEYVPIPAVSTSSMMNYGTMPAHVQPQTIAVASEPSKLAQLTDEELLRLVPDELEY